MLIKEIPRNGLQPNRGRLWCVPPLLPRIASGYNQDVYLEYYYQTDLYVFPVTTFFYVRFIRNKRIQQYQLYYTRYTLNIKTSF